MKMNRLGRGEAERFGVTTATTKCRWAGSAPRSLSGDAGSAFSRALVVCLFACLAAGCGGDLSVSVDVDLGDPVVPGSSDPPYTSGATYPSGLKVSLIRDAALTAGYPASEQNPFGAVRQRHYARVGYFIDLPRAPLSQLLATNFKLSEFVSSVRQRGESRAYVDPQIVHHVQDIRSGLGRPLILNSGFRSPEHNRAVGGATFSRHIYGDALDIDVDQSRPDANQRAQEIFNEAQDVKVDFVLPLTETSVTVGGAERVSWVHIDDRGF